MSQKVLLELIAIIVLVLTFALAAVLGSVWPVWLAILVASPIGLIAVGVTGAAMAKAVQRQ
ncbi:membrane protein [Arthrobacter phage Emotion]|uniref:Membrane protein n=1 Tax=Arthrobacter phage Emotion TaxID=3038361 RepID=A0AA49IJY5_9CAUD|nr:membrane protein [Arthrobacter phage Emotion]